jgi:putative zinc finger/helix-turn-helix YgiT family protein
MTCVQCGARLRTRRENCAYDAGGLPGVLLMNVEVSRCPECGDLEVSIPAIEDLHRLLALEVIHKKTTLAGTEIKFIRKYLGFSGVDFARTICVAPETISRWENGHEVISPTTDRLLRLMVANLRPVSAYPNEELKSIARSTVKPRPVKVSLRLKGESWRPVPVPA